MDIYSVAKTPSICTNMLILSKGKFLTFLLVLTTICSHTYSEITTSPIKANIKFPTALILQKSSSIGFSTYYLTPYSYLQPSSKKAPKSTTPSEMIMDLGSIKSNALARFLISTNINIDYSYAHNLAKIYIEEANDEGVNHDIAFAQMCLETGFLRFDGTVDKKQNNFCGLGVTGNGIVGLSFNNTRDGVRAHIQHLKAYGSTSKLSKPLIDKRFNLVKRGSATHIGGLTGSWASDVKYDLKIRGLLNRLYTNPS